MSMSDPIADMLTRVRNAGFAGLEEVRLPASKMKAALAEVLVDEGYVAEVRSEGDSPKSRELVLTLKYTGRRSRTPVIEGIERVSKPSCRVYVNSREIPRVLGGLGIAVLSTSEGILADRAARRRNIGGEVLCYVW